MFGSNDISLIIKGNSRFIEKKLLKDINMEMCISKKFFIDYLIDNSVSSAKIICHNLIKDRIIETQEYIEYIGLSSSIYDYVSLISRFHAVSREYEVPIIQKRILKEEVVIENSLLAQVLLGFEEKYFTYARRAFIDTICEEKIKKIILNMHEKIYRSFIQIANIEECIIHNDLTSNNIIQGANLTLIDFDFAIKSTSYVDLADILFSRNIEIEDYLKIMRDKQYLAKAISIYNKISGKNAVSLRGLKLMAAIKLFVFIMYIYSKNHSIETDLCEYLIDVGEEALDK